MQTLNVNKRAHIERSYKAAVQYSVELLNVQMYMIVGFL